MIGKNLVLFGLVGVLSGSCVSWVASTAAKAEDGHWETVKQEELKGVTPYGIFQLLDRYPDQFVSVRQDQVNRALAGLPPRVLNLVSVTLITSQWKGATVCPAGDPRLSWNGIGGSEVCWTDPSADHDPCEGTAIASLDRDPCAPPLGAKN